MTIDALEIITEQPRTWREFTRTCARAEIWTDDGHRIDGANRGDRTDLGITIARPQEIAQRIGNRALMRLIVTIDHADRQTIKQISARYGTWPDEITVTREY